MTSPDKKDKIGFASQKRLKTAATYVVLLFFFAISIIPIFIVFITAFKTDAEMSLAAFRWLPADFTYMGNFEAALRMGNWPRYFWNTIIVTFFTLAGSLFFNSIAGYAFAKLKFYGRDFLFILLLVGMMVSPQSVIIPQFIMMRSVPLAGGNDILGAGGVGLLNTYASLIIPFLSGSFGIFLCRQFYSTIPDSLQEAAYIDGSGPIRTYFYIYLPLSGTVLATLTIFRTIASWNDFFYPLIMTQTAGMRTVQLALQMFRGGTVTHYNHLMAATLMTILPIIIVYFFAQKFFVQGMASTGMKN